MSTPFITIIHNVDYTCKLLILYDANKYYYSEYKSHKQLRKFLKPTLIETHVDKLIIHSKNNRHILIIN